MFAFSKDGAASLRLSLPPAAVVAAVAAAVATTSSAAFLRRSAARCIANEKPPGELETGKVAKWEATEGGFACAEVTLGPRAWW